MASLLKQVYTLSISGADVALLAAALEYSADELDDIGLMNRIAVLARKIVDQVNAQTA